MRVPHGLQRGAEGLHHAALCQQWSKSCFYGLLARTGPQLCIGDHRDRAPGGQEVLKLLRALGVRAQIAQRHQQLELHVGIGPHVFHDAHDFDVLVVQAKQLAHRVLGPEDFFRESARHHCRARLVEQHAGLSLKQLEVEDLEEGILREHELLGVVLLVTHRDEALPLRSDPHGLRDLGDRFHHGGPERRHDDAHRVTANAERLVDAEHAINIVRIFVKAVVRSLEAHVDEDEQRARDADHQPDDVDHEEQRVSFQKLPTEVQVLQKHVAPLLTLGRLARADGGG